MAMRFKERRTEYVDCTCTEDHVFALYSGGPRTRGEDTYEERVRKRSGVDVHVFGWKGQLERTFRLDHRAFSLAVDPGEQYLYTGSLIDGRVRRYRIPPGPQERK
jgi:hypothetical protein